LASFSTNGICVSIAFPFVDRANLTASYSGAGWHQI
jgi:hypothetical protein